MADSPPAPPPPSAFPYCKCDRSYGAMPFGLAAGVAPTLTRAKGSNNAIYCWALERLPCDASVYPASCSAATSISKLEWQIPDSCRGSAKSFTVDGVKRSWVWETRTFRIPFLAGWQYRSADLAAPKKVCLELNANSQCATLDKWCGGAMCNISVFDQTKQVCPTLKYPLA